MSNTNVWKSVDMAAGEEDVQVPPLNTQGSDVDRYTDGEELMAVNKIIELLDNLDNGEVIVITREMY